MNLVNYKNYFVYADSIKNPIQRKIVYVPKDITRENISDHITGITNILKDGVETELVHNMKITVQWDNGQCDLSIIDYWYNLFMWSMILQTNKPIRPKHIFFQRELKRKHMKEYIDRFVCNKENKINIDNSILNNIICEGLYWYNYIELFSWYLANTINNEDDIDLMNTSPEFFDLMHVSLEDVPFENVKSYGMQIVDKSINIIKNSKELIGYEHGLTNSFRANEAINPRQYKEVQHNIGAKPNGMGGIYPYNINTSFKMGGVNNPLYYFIESQCARIAQMLSKENVGDSGDLARILGLNNIDTILNPNPKYKCLSQHFTKYEVKSDKHLSVIKNRYYRLNPRGVDYYIDEDNPDKSLVGKIIYLHGPMTCASKSSGHGICSKCYGNLYYTNNKINVGKYASENLSSQTTQILLSAKHLLEAAIRQLKWNVEFNQYFDVDINMIKLSEQFASLADLRRYTLIIDPNDVELINDEEKYSFSDDNDDDVVADGEGLYNEYITKFVINTPGGDIEFSTDDKDHIFISNELNNIIRRRANNKNGMVNVPLTSLEDIPLFFVKINNNEISKTMDDIINVLNKVSVTCSLTKDEALQQLVDLTIKGGITIDAVHLEVLLSNQIVSKNDILKKPNWNNPKEQYVLLTLNQALTNNPSVIVSLLYKDLRKTLYTPLTFQKNAPSFFDLFFVETPQQYISDDFTVNRTDVGIRDEEKYINIATVVEKPKELKDIVTIVD